MHDSYTPLGGMVPLVHMKLGEVSPGGVGVGLNGLLILAILSVFIAGLMVGRTPEYLGKKIQSAEVKLVVLYILAMPAIVLIFIAISTFVEIRERTYRSCNPGSHGFTEIIYAFTSAGNNNGSAFAGITANTALDEHRARPCHAGRPVLPDHPDAGARRRRWCASAASRRPPARSPRTHRSSSCW